MEASKGKQSNPFGKERPHCKELLLCEDIKMESQAPNPYDYRGKGVGSLNSIYLVLLRALRLLREGYSLLD